MKLVPANSGIFFKFNGVEKGGKFNIQLIRPCKFWNFIVKKKIVSFDSFYGYYVLVLFFETYTILKCEMISFQ